MSNLLNDDLLLMPESWLRPTLAISQPERRLTPRLATRQQGALILQADAQSLDCAILDVSESGARVTIRQARQVPRDVPLLLSHNGHAVAATVAWQLGFDLGLKFATPDRAAGPAQVAA